MEIFKLSAEELANKLASKEISSEEVANSFLSRISITDDKINSFNYVNKDIIEKAKEIDKLRLSGAELPFLAGVPIAIKDNICTKNIPTTCSSKILENFIPPYDATVIEKLNSQYLLNIGKVNLDEFAMGSSTENSAFRVTNNPWDTTRVAGGSSGGSISSVASSQAPLSLGSDTGGSIRLPASFCGVVGLKPTYGLVSRYGLVAYASSLDQIGPVSKTVKDNALLLNILAGNDPKDSTSLNFSAPDYTKSLNRDIKGLKVAMPKEMFEQGLSEEVKNSVMNSIKKLESMGAIVEEVSLPLVKYGLAAYYIIATAEASSNLSRYDGVKYGFRAEGNIKTLEELYLQSRSQAFGDEVKRRIMTGTYVLSSGYYDAYYKKALQYRTLLIKELNNIFANYDVIVSPTAPTTAWKKGELKDPLSVYLMDILTVIVNLAGIPAISVPCGLDSNNLPIGIQFMAKALNEETLYQVSYSLEQELNLNLAPNL
ncbi:MAG: Asp-tRNA(Asn)/Glu-tRNA(Gln) amidotransferase subunit GatA [Candidatus Sericytochromatia bacterium]